MVLKFLVCLILLIKKLKKKLKKNIFDLFKEELIFLIKKKMSERKKSKQSKQSKNTTNILKVAPVSLFVSSIGLFIYIDSALNKSKIFKAREDYAWFTLFISIYFPFVVYFSRTNLINEVFIIMDYLIMAIIFNETIGSQTRLKKYVKKSIVPSILNYLENNEDNLDNLENLDKQDDQDNEDNEINEIDHVEIREGNSVENIFY